jgi:hypothetical protein
MGNIKKNNRGKFRLLPDFCTLFKKLKFSLRLSEMENQKEKKSFTRIVLGRVWGVDAVISKKIQTDECINY